MAKYYMLNKPKGYVTARTDPLNKTVMDLFPEEERFLLHPVGRLDKDTEGLLLITDDGMLTHRLMQPKSHISKTYFFYAIGRLTEEKQEMIREGVMLQGQARLTLPAQIVCLSEGKITEITEYLPESKREKLLKNPEQDIFSGTITITEGRNHQVKRMLRAIDCCIVYLERIAIGELRLDRGLSRGEYRELKRQEMQLLGI